jgi:hypothetical protein
MESLKSMISESEVKRLVGAHITLQIGCYFSKTQPCLSGLVTTSKWIEDYYWNSLSSFQETSLFNLLESAEALFLAENRILAVYLDPSCRPVNTADHLVDEGFSYEREVWMSPVSVPPPRASKYEITRISPSDIDDFLKVFSIGFGGPATEADGYGDIPPTYLSALKDSFNGHASAGVEHVHFIARSGGRAVGCGSVHIGKHLVRFGTGLTKSNNFYLLYKDFLSSVSPLCPGDGDDGAKRNNFPSLVMG